MKWEELKNTKLFNIRRYMLIAGTNDWLAGWLVRLVGWSVGWLVD